MKIRALEQNDIDKVEQVIYGTIDSCYPKAYCPEAIAYFKEFHSKEKIRKDAEAGNSIVLLDGSEVIGTGTLLNSEIRRVFVLKGYQKHGLGKLIMNRLEEIAIQKGINKAILCASMVSKKFYENLGYKTAKEDRIDLGDGKSLDYYDMYKELTKS